MLEKTLESPLISKEIQPFHPKGNQSWIFVRRTDTEVEVPVFWLPDVKSRLLGKDSDAGKDWRQEEKGMSEDEIVGWHHWLNGHEKLQEVVKDREAWHAEVYELTKSRTQLSNWTPTIESLVSPISYYRRIRRYLFSWIRIWLSDINKPF